MNQDCTLRTLSHITNSKVLANGSVRVELYSVFEWNFKNHFKKSRFFLFFARINFHFTIKKKTLTFVESN